MIHKIFIILITLSISLFHQQANPQHLHTGIIYEQKAISSPCAASIHIITIDPTQAVIELVKANNLCNGLTKITTMAKDHNALAGINGGFHQSDGTPSGICKIDTTWYTTQKLARAALGWKNDGSAWIIDIIDTQNTLTINNQQFPVHQFNQARQKDQAVMY